MDYINKVEIRQTLTCTYFFISLYKHNVYSFESLRCHAILNVSNEKQYHWNSFPFDIFYVDGLMSFNKNNLKLLKILDKI